MDTYEERRADFMSSPRRRIDHTEGEKKKKKKDRRWTEELCGVPTYSYVRVDTCVDIAIQSTDPRVRLYVSTDA